MVKTYPEFLHRDSGLPSRAARPELSSDGPGVTPGQPITRGQCYQSIIMCQSIDDIDTLFRENFNQKFLRTKIRLKVCGYLIIKSWVSVEHVIRGHYINVLL